MANNLNKDFQSDSEKEATKKQGDDMLMGLMAHQKHLPIVKETIEQLSDTDVKSLQMRFRQATKRDLVYNLSHNDELFVSPNEKQDEEFHKNVNDAIEQENKWRYNHSQRASQIDDAIDVFQGLDDSHRTVMKEYYDVDDDFDLIDTLGDYDEFFNAQDAQGNELTGKDALRQNIDDIYSQEMPAANLNAGLDDLSNLSQDAGQEQ